MTNAKKITTLVLTVIMLMCLVPATVFAAGKSGWYQKGNYWYYYQADKMLARTWLKWQSNWYYFGDDGRMIENGSTYVDFEKKAYVFDKGGALTKKTGWVSRGGVWYYVKKGGIATTGWKKIGGKWYYFFKKGDEAAFYGIGSMVDVPSVTIGGTVYAFNNSGSLVTKTGWVNISYYGTSYWFYVKKGGICMTGWQKIGGKWYYFEDYGPMLSNTTRVINGKNYKFDKNGVCLNP